MTSLNAKFTTAAAFAAAGNVNAAFAVVNTTAAEQVVGGIIVADGGAQV